MGNSRRSSKRSSSHRTTTSERDVAQALETARETEEGGLDPEVYRILDDALTRLWAKIQGQPDSYIMTQTEMALFTYFQQNFVGNEVAIAARKRYWDNVRG